MTLDNLVCRIRWYDKVSQLQRPKISCVWGVTIGQYEVHPHEQSWTRSAYLQESCPGVGRGEGGKGGRGKGIYHSYFKPASRTLFSRFPPPSLVLPALLCIFLLRKIARCEICFLFLSAPVPLGTPSSALSSPASRGNLVPRAFPCSRGLPAPVNPGFPTPCHPPLQRGRTKRRAPQNCWTVCYHVTYRRYHFWAVVVCNRAGTIFALSFWPIYKVSFAC